MASHNRVNSLEVQKMTVPRLTRLALPILLLWACAAAVFADTAVIPETMPTGIPEVLVGGYTVRGLGDQSLPTRTGDDAVIWGGKNQSEMVPPLTTYTPQTTPSGNTYSTYPYAGGQGWTLATIGNFRTSFGAISPGEVLDNFSLFFTLNETGGKGLPVTVETLDVTIINHLNPDPIDDWDNPNYIMARFTMDAPPSPAVPPLTPDPFFPPYNAQLLNDSQAGHSVADYEFKFVGGLHLASYAAEEYIRLELGMSELSSGSEVVWARTSLAVPGDFDYGDAPDSYGTLQVSGGPYHGIGAHEWLGTSWDGEPDGQPTDGAYGDNATGLADEDGVWYEDGMAHVTISVDPADLTGTRYGPEDYRQIYLDGWLDWDRDGSFDVFGDVDDHIVVAHAENPLTWGGASSKTLDFAIPGFIPNMLGNYFRWRLSYGSAVTGSGGYSPYGEVEDYYVTPEPATVVLLGGALVALARRRRRRKA
jgi:hypothetical protein